MNTAQKLCLGCRRPSVGVLVDFGLQPPSNRFEYPNAAVAETHPLVVGQCVNCGLYQLIAPMPPAVVKSRFQWLTYNEPEGHLDDLVSRLCRLPGIGSEARIVGLTYKDDTTLARFNKLGFANSYRIDADSDLNLHDACAGLESIQSALDMATASRLARERGQADLLLVRHVLEHAHDPIAFFYAVKALVKPGGYLLFEVPDCTKFVDACDYSFVWEEHVTYFCQSTLEAFVQNLGCQTTQTIVYPYPLEDSLITVVRNAPQPRTIDDALNSIEALLAQGKVFSHQHPETRARLQTVLRAWTLQGKRVAIFGAGHLAAKFVNIYALGRLIDGVVDDNPNKQALLMPGSRLPIYASAALESRGIEMCLLSLNPESEQKVLAKNESFLRRGGKFMSMFALSPRSIYHA